ncbi:MAG: RHS repeat-associated core domain-containing protein [Acidobacteriota bacterium]
MDQPVSTVGEGRLAVGENGDARYHLPILVPPGRGRAMPELGLVYSSQRGDGRLGMGWRLQGGSAITRCAAIPAVDGRRGTVEYGSGDRYCLDGQRLINVEGDYGSPGSKYRTELETWRLVEASEAACGSGPCSFTVVNRSGETSFYGVAENDSRITAVGRDDVRVWALARHVDRNHNAIDLLYTDEPVAGASAADGQFYLKEIAYTSNLRAATEAQRFVRFEYAARPQVTSAYIGGARVVTRALLANVRTFLGSDPVKDYRLEYEVQEATGRSLLVAARECAGAQDDALCLPPTRIHWQDPGPVTFRGQSLGAPRPAPPEAVLPMDVSGDGKGDLVYVTTAENQLVATALISDGEAFDPCPYVLEIPRLSGAQLLPAEITRDGRGDLIYLYADQDRLAYAAFVANDDTCGFEPGPEERLELPARPDHLWPMDANGDGITDLVLAWRQLTVYSVVTLLGSADGFAVSGSREIVRRDNERFWPAEVNGDGMVDLVQAFHAGGDSIRLTTYLSDGRSFAAGLENDLRSGSTNLVALWPLDVNGDGKTDLVQGWAKEGTTLQLSTFLADGAGGFVCERLVSGGFAPGCTTDTERGLINAGAFWPMDADGDRRIDLVQAESRDGVLDLVVYRNLNTGFDKGRPADATLSSTDVETVWPMDLDGDGKTDLVQGVTGLGSLRFEGYLSQGEIPDLADGLIDSVGGTVEITYLPLSDPEVYTAGVRSGVNGDGTSSDALTYPYRQTPAQGPFQRVGGSSMQVVRRVVRSNDPEVNASTYRYSEVHSYEGGLTDLASGRGWQGFRQVRRLNEVSGRRTVTTLNQGFPLTGTTAEITYQCDGRIAPDPRCPEAEAATRLSASETRYEAALTATGVSQPFPKVWEVLKKETLLHTFSYGDDDFTRRKTFEHDACGNVVRLADWGTSDRLGRDLDPADNVFTCSRYDNRIVTPEGDISCQQASEIAPDSWQIGFLTGRKISAVEACSSFEVFDAADFELQHLAYTQDRNLESRSIYDNTPPGHFLTTSYTYDDFGNRITETPPGPGDRTTHLSYDDVYKTFLATITSPANERGERLVHHLGFDPRFGVRIASATPAGKDGAAPGGNVSVHCLDNFGRVSATQGPLPQAPANVAADPNCVAADVTGDRDLFQTAQVVTLTRMSRQRDDSRRILLHEEELQDWTREGEEPLWRWRRLYVDGLGRDYLSVAEEAPAVGLAASCSNFFTREKRFRQSIPRYVASVDELDCTSSDGADDLLWASQTFDVYGRVVRHVVPAGPDGSETSVTSKVFDKSLRVTITRADEDPYRLAKVLEYDYYASRRKLRRITLPADESATTVFDYDAIGRLTSTTDPVTPDNPLGVTNTITYDSLSRRTSIDNPDQNTCSEVEEPLCEPGRKALVLGYDPATGLLASTTDAKGQVTRFHYDALSRMIRKELPPGEGSGVIRYHYDDPDVANGLGRRTGLEARNPAGDLLYRYGYAYDRQRNRSETLLELDGRSWVTRRTFDPLRRLQQLTYPSGFEIERSYRMGHLAEIASPETAYARFSDYAPVGGPRQVDYGNGTLALHSYSPTGEPIHTRLDDSLGQPLLDTTLSWNHLQQVTSLADQLQPDGIDTSQQFDYSLTRLTLAEAPGLYGTRLFDYDASGNLTAKDGYGYDYEAHRVVAGSGVEQPPFQARYDLNGNLTRKELAAVRWDFHYDVRNRLIRVDRDDESLLAVNLYDDAGRRLQKQTPDGIQTLYISPIFQVTRHADGSEDFTHDVTSSGGIVATVTSRQNASAGDSPVGGIPRPGTLYLHRDHLRSTSLTTGEDGQLATRVAYQPYGGVYQPGTVGPDDFRPKFQGKELDETANLYDFGARYLDPTLGRFLRSDTRIASHLSKVDTFNRFAFAVNNPVTFVDPSGHSIWDSILGAIVGAAEVVAGVAVDVLSDGALESVGGALLGAGMNGFQYSVTHSGNFSWKQYGVQEGEGALFGLLTGGFGGEAEAGVAAATSEAAEGSAAGAAEDELASLTAESEGRALGSAADRGLGEELGEASGEESELGDDAEGCASSLAASFPAGTLVWTVGGRQPIESLADGAAVLSRNSIDWQNRWRLARSPRQRETRDLISLLLVAEEGGEEQLVATADHPLHSAEGWRPAATLQVGDRLATAAGWALVTEIVGFTSSEPVTVYNFEVPGYASYFVGRLGVWAHNPRCWDRGVTRRLGHDEPHILRNMRNIAARSFDRNSTGVVTVLYEEGEEAGFVFVGRSGNAPGDAIEERFGTNLRRDIEQNVDNRTHFGRLNCGEFRACNQLERLGGNGGRRYLASFWRDTGNLANPCPNCAQWVYGYADRIFLR